MHDTCSNPIAFVFVGICEYLLAYTRYSISVGRHISTPEEEVLAALVYKMTIQNDIPRPHTLGHGQQNYNIVAVKYLHVLMEDGHHKDSFSTNQTHPSSVDMPRFVPSAMYFYSMEQRCARLCCSRDVRNS